ncbi:MAG: hypothetical protein DSZ03_03715 [Sulfurimonas sp.]|nr:MAG: hypothetical protein DSZ03_03715 [Sulfurimonas sp.]
MKEKLTAFIQQLTLYDYVLFAMVILLVILLLSLAIIVRKKVALSMTLFIFAVLLLVTGPTIGYMKLRQFLYKTTTSITEVKTLEFSQALVLKGVLYNASKRHLSTCNITAKIFKVSGHPYLDMLYPLNPFKKMSILKEVNLSVGEHYEFKMIVEPFTYTKEYNLSIGATCR